MGDRELSASFKPTSTGRPHETLLSQTMRDMEDLVGNRTGRRGKAGFE